MEQESSRSTNRQLHLVLWDVDHTLIETRGVGRRLFADTFREVAGIPMREMAPMEGRTEPVIFLETLKLHGISPTDDLRGRFLEGLADAYDAGTNWLRQQGRALPGAKEALQALAARDDVVQSVLTGNVRRVAITKLETFDLARFIDFDAGAYGSDDDDRLNLVPIAVERAAKTYGAGITSAHVTVIGDTPNDIRAGLSGQANVIGITSGRHTAEELADAGAEVVLPDLYRIPEVVEALLR